MTVSIVNIFKVGLGPSSSHTMGPMIAGLRFVKSLQKNGLLDETDRVIVELYGSLALTGVGHGTPTAVQLGLSGLEPQTSLPEQVKIVLSEISETRRISLIGIHSIDFDPKKNIVFLRRKTLPKHPNGLKFIAYRKLEPIMHRTFYSVGGGVVIDESQDTSSKLHERPTTLKWQFANAKELIETCDQERLTIADIVMENENCLRPQAQTEEYILKIWDTMNDCIERGFRTSGTLPGHLKVRRRASELFLKLNSDPEGRLNDNLRILDWVNLYALSVNEENAAGSRVVTAPTNGAAGIIPAVGRYFSKFTSYQSKDDILKYLLTASAIASLYTQNASISGAEVGCQGEVGVACSMAAGALTAVLGGSPAQVAQAAEIGMEHNLGLTCDPVGGLVQIPCIERNAMGAVKAINASRIALLGEGKHYISLDSVIETMRQTGLDMKTKYKETSRGGLAVAYIEC